MQDLENPKKNPEIPPKETPKHSYSLRKRQKSLPIVIEYPSIKKKKKQRKKNQLNSQHLEKRQSPEQLTEEIQGEQSTPRQDSRMKYSSFKVNPSKIVKLEKPPLLFSFLKPEVPGAEKESPKPFQFLQKQVVPPVEQVVEPLEKIEEVKIPEIDLGQKVFIETENVKKAPKTGMESFTEQYEDGNLVFRHSILDKIEIFEFCESHGKEETLKKFNVSRSLLTNIINQQIWPFLHLESLLLKWMDAQTKFFSFKDF